MSGLRRTLTFTDGLVLSIGSILGSGILFLPSLTYQTAGNSVLFSWIAATLLCFPILIIFRQIAKTIPSEAGIEEWTSRGLGSHIGAAVPLLMLGTVSIGMPASAVIAARFVERLGSGHAIVGIGVSLILITIPFIVNLMGVRAGRSFLKFVAIGLFAIGLLVFVTTWPKAQVTIPKLKVTWDTEKTLRGSILAFWAYAGFENLSFIAGEFKHPERDIPLSTLVALIACGLLYTALTLNFVALVPLSQIDPVAGLYQLATFADSRRLMTILVTSLAIGAILINFTAWGWGVSRALYSAADKGLLPSYFAHLESSSSNSEKIPRRALVFLLFIFLTMAIILQLFPTLLEIGLQVASTNFVLIYFLCTAAYATQAQSWTKRFFGLLMAVFLGAALMTSSWLLLYPSCIMLLAGILSIKRSQAGFSSKPKEKACKVS